MYCPSCGKRAEDESRFCSHCGRGLQSPAPANHNRTPSPSRSLAAASGSIWKTFVTVILIIAGIIAAILIPITIHEENKRAEEQKAKHDLCTQLNTVGPDTYADCMEQLKKLVY